MFNISIQKTIDCEYLLTFVNRAIYLLFIILFLLAIFEQNTIIIQCNIIISMNKLLAGQFKTLPTFTVRELEKRILTKNNRNVREKENSGQEHQRSNDLKRIPQHKSNCKCKFHHRQRDIVQRRFKCHTQPDEICIGLISPKAQNKQYCQMTPPINCSPHFQDKKNYLSGNEIKKRYYQYLKTLPPIDTSKSQRKVDCYNLTFEQFLKKNYQTILNSQNASKQIPIKESDQLNQFIQTEGAINLDNGKRQSLCNKKEVERRQSLEGRLGHHSYRNSISEAFKLQKLGQRRASSQILQLIDEEDTTQQLLKPQTRNRRKAKIINTRPSLLVECQNQNIFKSICLRFAHQDKASNEEGKKMVKQLVEADINVYKKALQDIQQQIKQGINIRNLQADRVSKLVKIVLHKIQKEAKLINNTNKHYDLKNQMIDVMCGKYGWKKEQKTIKLQQFWKLRRQSINPMNRKSLLFDSKSKLEKKKIVGQKHLKFKIPPGQNLQYAAESTLSGFALQRRNSGNVQRVGEEMSHRVSTSNFAISEKESPNLQQKLMGTQFKFTSSKKMGMKKGSFMKNNVVGLKSKMVSRESLMRKNTNTIFTVDDLNKKGAYLLQPISGPDCKPTVPKYVQKEKIKQQTVESPNNRYSSMCFGLRDTVQHYMDHNKMFLRRIEHKLIDNDCSQLVINMNEGIITKKRKIRAIHTALQRESIKRSDYYQDLIQYLDIYEDYCNLVVQTKRDDQKAIKIPERKKGKRVMQTQIINFMDEFIKEKQFEETQINDLLEDLRKERQLKYITVQIILEDENPKEELILKLPQYTTNKPEDPAQNVKKQTIIFHSHQQSQQLQQSIESDLQYRNIKNESCLSQKSLTEQAHVTYGRSTQTGQQQNSSDSEYEFSAPIQKQFQKKLERYRKLLKLPIT